MRHVAIQRVMGAGLISENVGNDTALHNFRQNICAITNQTHRKRFSILARLID